MVPASFGAAARNRCGRGGDEDALRCRHARGVSRGAGRAADGHLLARGASRRAGQRGRGAAVSPPGHCGDRLRHSLTDRPGHGAGDRFGEHPARRPRLPRPHARAARAAGGDRQRWQRGRDRRVEDRRGAGCELRRDAHPGHRRWRRPDPGRSAVPRRDRLRGRARAHRRRPRRASLRVRGARPSRVGRLREGGEPRGAGALRRGRGRPRARASRGGGRGRGGRGDGRHRASSRCGSRDLRQHVRAGGNRDRRGLRQGERAAARAGPRGSRARRPPAGSGTVSRSSWQSSGPTPA